MSGDDALRNTFRKQIDAFDPLQDDSRIPTLRARLATDGDDFDASLELARLYEGYGLHDDALEQYLHSLNLALRSADDSARAAARQSIAAGIARNGVAAQRASEAIAMMDELASKSPSAALENQIGMLYGSSGDHRAAESAYRAAILRDPGLGSAYNNLGYSLLLQGQLDEAEKHFRKAIEINSRSATAHNNLALLLARRGALPEAWEQFRLAAPDLAVAHNNFAVALMETGHLEQSREHLVQSLKHKRAFAPALENFRLVQAMLHKQSEQRAAAAASNSQEKKE